MPSNPPSLADLDDPDDGAESADDVIDITDRRRVFVRAVFGVDFDPTLIDALFEADEDRVRSG